MKRNWRNRDFHKTTITIEYRNGSSKTIPVIYLGKYSVPDQDNKTERVAVFFKAQNSEQFFRRDVWCVGNKRYHTLQREWYKNIPNELRAVIEGVDFHTNALATKGALEA